MFWPFMSIFPPMGHYMHIISMLLENIMWILMDRYEDVVAPIFKIYIFRFQDVECGLATVRNDSQIQLVVISLSKRYC